VYATPSHAVAQRSSALITLVAHSALLIGYRLHSLVLAAAHGVPAFGVDYDPKVSSFGNEMGFHGCYPAEVHEQAAFHSLSELWHARDDFKTTLALRRDEAVLRLEAAEQRLHAIL
jgi:polysaccharide pyruvyl transferase WcaK-like protein